ncbi:hypothetical protein MMC25_001411 [Agyrium rufum]|nr:hypothetical protein [Agyrium rufum]
MESMRTLNRSLPRSSRRSHSKLRPSEQLLQDFKTAALSVTNLYKNAASDEARVREAGYQDALDELLVFLDKENLGLGDGEGWKVRRWATERLDGSPPAQATSDSDEERAEPEKRAESPQTRQEEQQRTASPETVVRAPSSKSSSPVRESPKPSIQTQDPASPQPPEPIVLPMPDSFTFTSTHPYPRDITMHSSDDAEPRSPQSINDNSNTIAPPTTSSSSVRFEFVPPRSTRSQHKHGNRHRSSNAARNLGFGAGGKRKVAFGDFFDLGNLGDGNGKDTFGGGNPKRGRMI